MEAEAKEKIVQMPLTGEYWNALEADAAKCDRVPSRQAAWIVKRYYDGEEVARAQIVRGDDINRLPAVGQSARTDDAGARQDAAPTGEVAQPVTDCSRLEESEVAS